MIEIGKPVNPVRSNVVTITTSTYEIDCNTFKNQIENLHLDINVGATTLSLVNSTDLTKITLMTNIILAGATVAFGSGFQMSSNNDPALTTANSHNTYKFMGNLSDGGVHQMGTLGTII